MTVTEQQQVAYAGPPAESTAWEWSWDQQDDACPVLEFFIDDLDERVRADLLARLGDGAAGLSAFDAYTELQDLALPDDDPLAAVVDELEWRLAPHVGESHQYCECSSTWFDDQVSNLNHDLGDTFPEGQPVVSRIGDDPWESFGYADGLEWTSLTGLFHNYRGCDRWTVAFDGDSTITANIDNTRVALRVLTVEEAYLAARLAVLACEYSPEVAVATYPYELCEWLADLFETVSEECDLPVCQTLVDACADLAPLWPVADEVTALAQTLADGWRGTVAELVIAACAATLQVPA